MTIRELKDWFGQYPDDAVVHARVVARNGRGGTFEEQLLLADSHHDEKENVVYVNCGFEIGWLNAHPEFQTPAGQDDGQHDDDTDEALAEGGGGAE